MFARMQGLMDCHLSQAPSAEALSRLRLLSLRNNRLATLPTASI